MQSNKDDIKPSPTPSLYATNSKLELNLSNQADLDKISSLSTTKLNDLKRISLQYMPNDNAELKAFLSTSAPSSLELLNLNFNGNIYINVKYYLPNLATMLLCTTREVSFYLFNMDNDDLSTCIQGCRNSERIKIWGVKLDSTKGSLDFQTNLVYKTKYLSIEACGGNLWTDVLAAIQKSSLKNSLTEIALANNLITCGTIKITGDAPYPLID